MVAATHCPEEGRVGSAGSSVEGVNVSVAIGGVSGGEGSSFTTIENEAEPLRSSLEHEAV